MSDCTRRQQMDLPPLAAKQLALAAQDFAHGCLSEEDEDIAEAIIGAMKFWECARGALTEEYGAEWVRKHPAAIGSLAAAGAILAARRQRE